MSKDIDRSLGDKLAAHKKQKQAQAAARAKVLAQQRQSLDNLRRSPKAQKLQRELGVGFFIAESCRLVERIGAQLNPLSHPSFPALVLCFGDNKATGWDHRHRPYVIKPAKNGPCDPKTLDFFTLHRSVYVEDHVRTSELGFWKGVSYQVIANQRENPLPGEDVIGKAYLTAQNVCEKWEEPPSQHPFLAAARRRGLINWPQFEPLAL